MKSRLRLRPVLSPVASKISWTLAEAVGNQPPDGIPDGMRRLLNRAGWGGSPPVAFLSSPGAARGSRQITVEPGGQHAQSTVVSQPALRLRRRLHPRRRRAWAAYRSPLPS